MGTSIKFFGYTPIFIEFDSDVTIASYRIQVGTRFFSNPEFVPVTWKLYLLNGTTGSLIDIRNKYLHGEFTIHESSLMSSVENYSWQGVTTYGYSEYFTNNLTYLDQEESHPEPEPEPEPFWRGAFQLSLIHI